MENVDLEDDEKKIQKGSSFWDTGWSLLFLIAAILLARYYVLEPFKIPSGSMEPTLVGHEDYGDRILTNKLAYAPAWHVILTMVVSAIFIVFAFIVSRAWRRKRSIFIYATLFVTLVGGTGFLWAKDSVASTPKRFDVVVFEYEKSWESPNSAVRMNYIKRLCGLPGETLVISGGDLFLRDREDQDTILRKWQIAPELQEQFWYPVSKAWSKNEHRQITDEDKARLAFPWKGAELDKAGVKLLENSLLIDGSSPVVLDYNYRVTNLHIKQGRWTFKHVGCPATQLPGETDTHGVVWRNPKNAPSEIVRAYVTHPWEGVQCPQCQRVLFPLELGHDHLQPWQPSSPVYMELTKDEKDNQDALPPEVSRFFYGGDDTVGDLKIELELTIESADSSCSLDLEVGSNVHSARWTLGKSTVDTVGTSVHAVRAQTPPLSLGKHRLSLAYLDATVIASLDGTEVERWAVDSVTPIGRAATSMRSIARISLQGIKGQLTQINLYRDQYYMPMLKGSSANERARLNQTFDSEKSTNVITIPQDMFLMLGDNAPSSSDGRIWGFVPRKNILGRAAFVWWPMSRWKTITNSN